MARKKIVRKTRPKEESAPPILEAIAEEAPKKKRAPRKSKAAAAAVTKRIAEQEEAKKKAEVQKLDESRVYFWRCRKGSPQHIGAFFTIPIRNGEVPMLTNDMWYTSYKDPDQDWPMNKSTITCQVCKAPLPVFTTREGDLIPRNRFVSSMTREEFEALTADVEG